MFLTVELTFFAANLGKLFSGGWLPLAVGAVFFVVLTTWRRGRAHPGTPGARGAQVPLRRFLNRLIDEQPLRVAGTAVFLSSTPDTVPAALLNNLEHNHVVHEQVVLLTVVTSGRSPRPRRPAAASSSGCGWGSCGITASYGYQDDARRAGRDRAWRSAQGLEYRPRADTYYVNHVIADPGRRRPHGGLADTAVHAALPELDAGRPLLQPAARPRVRGAAPTWQM